MRRAPSPQVIAGILALAAVVALAVKQRRRPGRQAASPPNESTRREWRCQCGQEYLVTGADRHRIYWLADADAENPVLGQECASCGASLPAEREHRAPTTSGSAPHALSGQGPTPSTT
jgi:MYXO-CTERM domain-containing protein